MMINKNKGFKMNKNDIRKFLTENDITWTELEDHNEFWIESVWMSSMSRKDNAQARKTLRLLCKKYKLTTGDFSMEPTEWKYNDKVGKYTFKGQKVEDLKITFDDNNLIEHIHTTFITIFEEEKGYKANSSWATKSDREEAMFKMHMSEFCLSIAGTK